MNFTIDQRKAIELRGTNILVSASAGSGKTAVLIERIIQLLKDEKDLGLKNMVVMTFTRAAASEMKERLYRRIHEEYRKDGNSKWQRCLLELPNAYICTIDSFCNSIVRDHFYKLGIDVDFNILDSVDESLYSSEILDELIEDEYTENNNSDSDMASFKELTDYFDSGIFVKGIKEVILHIADFCNSEPWPDEFLAKIEQQYRLEKEREEKENNGFEYRILTPIILKLLDVVRTYLERMRELKKEAGMLSFSDLEHYALKVLVERVPDNRGGFSSVATEAAKSYSETFWYIMVDEYQDSNYVQEEIISGISNGHNVFMVGDIKQSIYRFRQAKCDIFRSKLEDFREGGKKGQALFLNKNFRSEAKIIDFINRIFQKVMDGESYSMVYDKEQELVSGLERRALTDGIHLLFVEKDYSYNPEESGLDLHYAQARVIADEIKMLAENESGLYNRGESGRCSYKDMVILLRKKQNCLSAYIEELEKAGIPYMVDSSTGFLDLPQVVTLINYLRLIDNSNQDIALAGVMLSNIGRFSAQDLVQIRLSDSLDRSFHSLVFSCHTNEKLKKDEILFDKLLQFKERLEGYRLLSSVLSVDELIRTVIRETGMLSYIRNFEDAESREDALNQLVILAKEFGSRGYRGLAYFVEYLDKIKENELLIQRAKKPHADLNAVRIMTVHGSKGLEFPIVFYSELGANFKADTKQIALSSEKGIGIPLIDLKNRYKSESKMQRKIKEDNKKQDVEEEIRLMYVAMTRAKTRLYLISGGNLKKNIEACADYEIKKEKGSGENPASEYEKNNLSAYLVMALFHYNKEFFANSWKLLQMMKEKEKPSKSKSKKTDEAKKLNLSDLITVTDKDYKKEYENFVDGIRFKLCADVFGNDSGGLTVEHIISSVKGREETIQIMAPSDHKNHSYQKILVDLIRNLNFRYPNPYYDKPEKISVSEYNKTSKILEMTEEDTDKTKDLYWKKKIDLSEKKRSSEQGATKGTLYHKLMEFWDFSKEYQRLEDVQKEIERVIARGYIPQENKDIFQTEKIMFLVNSKLYQDMKKAFDRNLLFRERGFLFQTSVDRVYGDMEKKKQDQITEKQKIMIEGIIDVYYLDEDGIVLIDYKTDKNGSEAYYREHYSASLNMYADALDRVYEEKVKAIYVYSFEKDQAIKIDRKP